MTLLHGKSIHLLATFILLNDFHEPFCLNAPLSLVSLVLHAKEVTLL